MSAPLTTHILPAVVAGLMLAFAAPTVVAEVQQGYETVTSTGTVYRVVDGDTLVVNLTDARAYEQLKDLANGDAGRLGYFNERYDSIRVRLANVDTAESVHPDEDQNTDAGDRISAIVTEKLEGRSTRVSCFDWGGRDRAICSMTLPGGEDLGQWLIGNGYSDYVTYWGRHPYLDDEYRAAEGGQ